MSSAAKKKDDEPILEIVDPSTDRELRLSKNFEDPALDDILSGVGANPSEGVPLSVVEETVEAVHELVQEASAIDLGSEIPQFNLQLAEGSESEAMENLPLPDADFGTSPIDLFATSALEAPAAPAQSPPASLPKTVNPDPDPLERSLLLSIPADNVEDPVSMFMLEGHSADSRQDGTLYVMSEKLFDLVVCEKKFEELVEAALMAIMSGVDCQAGSVLELDHEHEDFFFRASKGGAEPVEKLRAFRVPLTKGIVGHVAESGQSLLLRDLSEDKMQMRAISLSVGFEAKTCMAAPIVVGGQPYGVIEVFNRKDGSLFEEKDLHVLEDGVRMFAKVLEVRFLLAELMRRVR